MTKEEREEKVVKKVSEFLDSLDSYDYDVDKVEFFIGENTCALSIARMYDYIPINFEFLEGLADIFGTRRFDIDQSHFNGCETCDYGSEYTKEFTFRTMDLYPELCVDWRKGLKSQ